MRRAAKVDDNQKKIMQTLRRHGCTVSSTASEGKGFPDLVVGHRGVNALVEVKDGSKKPSEQKLTKDQEKFHAEWDGWIVTIHNEEEAAFLVLEMRRRSKGL